ncbi:MAG: ABC transporter substrate-binding protein [Desulfobacula sp.]|nr:ABC transporter substrate-binding protein [Desulfobacula sp.]
MTNDFPNEIITREFLKLTPKNRKLGEYIISDPVRVTSMSTRKLAATCSVSEATVVRFAQKLGFNGYNEFQKALINEIQYKMTLAATGNGSPLHEDTLPNMRFREFVNANIKKIMKFVENLDFKILYQLIEHLQESSKVYVIGSYCSYAHASQFGWFLKEVRPGVQIINGSNSNSLEILTESEADSLAVIISQKPYPAELVRLSRYIKELKVKLAVIGDVLPCPMVCFSNITIMDSSFNLSAAGLPIMFRFIADELGIRDNDSVNKHKALLARARLDNRVFFDHPEILKIGRWQDITTLDPAFMNSLSRELTIMNCVYNGLVKYNEGTSNIVPDLAKSWDISRDGHEITFYLQEGVMFHRDYGEMTAEDVKFTIERISNPASSSPFKDMWSPLKTIQVINRYTVKMILKYQYPSLFTSILPANTGMIVSKKAVKEMSVEKFSFNPVGTGPYQFALYAPNNRIELTAFSRYKGLPPSIPLLVFVIKGNKDELEEDMANGRLDVIQLPLVNINKLDRLPNLNVITMAGQQTWWIGFTVNRPNMDNIKIRQAIRSAVDVENIIAKAFYGFADRANSLLPPGLLGFWENAPVYRQDLAKTRLLLKEAGIEDGFKVSLLMSPSRNARIISENIKIDLQKVGITVDMDLRGINAFNKASKSGDCDLYLSYFGSTLEPGYNIRWFKTGQPWNLSQWSNLEYDKTVNMAEIEMDFKKREDLYIKAQGIIDQDCLAIWLTHGNGIVVHQKEIDIGKVYPNGELAPWTIKKYN